MSDNEYSINWEKVQSRDLFFGLFTSVIILLRCSLICLWYEDVWWSKSNL